MPDDFACNFVQDHPSAPSSRSSDKSLTEMLSISDWRRFVPEAAGLLFLIWLARRVFNDTSVTYGAVHPFGIAVLLVASQYGVIGGLFATSLATSFFFARELPAQSAGQDFYGYAAAAAGQPCVWLGIALVIGGLRTLHKHHESELQEELRHTKLVAADLAHGLTEAVAEVGRAERRIALDADTLANFSHALGRLTLTSREALILSIGDLLEQVFGVTSFTIFLKDGNGLQPVLSVEDGVRLPRSATLSRIPAATEHFTHSADRGGHIRMPHSWPIRSSSGGKEVGILVCTRLCPAHDPTVAARRISDVCQLLAMLLPACLELAP